MSNITKLTPRGGATPRFKIKSRMEIMADQEPEWLIEDLYPQDCLAEVFGVPDAYKTFFALGAACAIATGEPFLGRYEVRCTGDVVYIYGEGGRGIGKRLLAWETSQGCKAERFFGIAEPVDMLSDEPGQVIADIKAATINPALIVLDTLARCFGDGDENATKDMNAFVQGCDQLRRAFPGCTILVVHHCGWEGTRGRGARAWEGALDTATRLEKGKGNLVTLTVTKQKDFAKPAQGVPLELVDVRGTKSAVLRLADAAKVKAAEAGTDGMVLGLLRGAGERGMTAAEMEDQLRITNLDPNPHTLKSSRQRLKRDGLAELRRGRWFAMPEPVVSPARERELRT
jgi:hypothetical protein